jgi:hypothetical protein
MWRKSFHHPSSIAKVRLLFFIRKTRYLMSLIYLLRSLSVPWLFEERFLRDVALDPTCQVHVAMGHMPCGFLSPTHLPSLFFPDQSPLCFPWSEPTPNLVGDRLVPPSYSCTRSYLTCALVPRASLLCRLCLFASRYARCPPLAHLVRLCHHQRCPRHGGERP